MRSLLFVAAMLAPMPALAAPCTTTSVSGTWALVSIRASDPDAAAFYRQVPNEVMRFGGRGEFMYVARRQPYDAAAAQRSLDQADAADGTTFGYQFDGNQLILLREGHAWEGFVCRIADGAEGSARAGDMILTNLPGRPAVLRVQRRLR